ncbi:MAG: universal stress protein [Nitrososphaeraceae archaeon]
MFKNILVAVDGSENSDMAFETAVELAKNSSSRLNVLHVAQSSMGRKTMVSPQMNDTLMDIARTIISSYKKKLEVNEKDLLKTKTLLKRGDAAQRIIETARAEKCDLVVIDSRGLGTFKQLLLGSVSQKVSNYTDCPVLIVR